MVGIGTLVNTAGCLVGGCLGLILKKGIPQRMQDTIFTAAGTGVFFIGITGVVTASITASADGTLSSGYMMIMLLSLVLGGILGEILRIDRMFERVGAVIKKRMGSAGEGGNGFAETTILFCSGAMAIIGSINDAVLGDPSMLYTKALLDCITGCIFAAVYGPSVLLSAFSVLLYQGTITGFAFLAGGSLAPVVVTQMGLVGNSILVLLGFSLMGVKKFNVANLIPATFFPILFHLLGVSF